MQNVPKVKVYIFKNLKDLISQLTTHFNLEKLH